MVVDELKRKNTGFLVAHKEDLVMRFDSSYGCIYREIKGSGCIVKND